MGPKKIAIARQCFPVFVATLMLLALVGTALAQYETGQISGIVTDQTGAVVPNAKVTVTSVNTGATRNATTAPDGVYTVSALPPGPYQVKIETANFAPTTKSVTVSVGGKVTADIQLAVAARGETVEVVGAGGVEVETQSQELSQVVNSKQILELPTITRNPYTLVGTAGNVQEDQGAFQMRGAGFSINGQRSASTDVLLDGGENVNTFTASVGQSVPLDSVQEFRVTTSDFSAEYGRASGGIVNVATKPGTNVFHGSAYEFNRVSKLATNTFDNDALGVPKSPFTRNQFGYSFGGPIKKNKLFFFNSTEWTRVRSNANLLNWVPDPALTALADPSTTGAVMSQLGQIRSGATITQVKTVGQLDCATCPITPHTGGPFSALPANTPAIDLLSFATPSDAGGGLPQNTINSVVRGDWNINDKTTMYARYAIFDDTFFAGSVNNSPYKGFDTGETDRNQNFILSLSHTFTPSLLTTGKLVGNRLAQQQPLGSAGIVPTFFLAGGAPNFFGQSFLLPGYAAGSPGNALPFGGPQNQIEYSQNLGWNHGAHQFSVGGEYVYLQDNRVFGAYEEGNSFYDNSGDAEAGFDAFLGGQLAQFSVAISPQGEFPCIKDNTGHTVVTPACTLTTPLGPPPFSRSNRYHDGAVYGQDSWKVRPRLTLNLGLRWEYYGVQHNVDPKLDSNFVLGTGSNIFQQVRNGQVFTVPNSPVHGLWAPQKKNFAPRIGFAWDVFGDGKTSLRGGYGMAYERNFGNVTFNVIQNPPNYAVLNVFSGDLPTLPASPANFGSLSAGGPGNQLAFPNPSLRWVDQNIKTAYSHLFSMAVEREVARNTVVALEYSGSHQIHGYDLSPYNARGYGVVYLGDDPTLHGGRSARNRLDYQYGNMNHRGNGAFSFYNALNTRLSTNNLWNSGLQLTANYTYSHAIDNLSSTFSDQNQNNNLGLLDPFQPKLDKGDADFDARHRITMSAIWDIPLAKNSSGWLKQVGGGWELAPIYTAHTGYPFTIFDCTNDSFGNANCARYIPSSAPPTSGHTGGPQTAPNVFSYINLPAGVVYAEPLTGEGELPTCDMGTNAAGNAISLGTNCRFPAGMSRRNAFRQPGAWNMNMGIYKNFKLTERFQMQFRGEFYNLFNHSNYYVQTGGPFNNGGASDVSPAGISATNPSLENPFTIIGKRGSTPTTTGGFGERRFIQLGLKMTF